MDSSNPGFRLDYTSCDCQKHASRTASRVESGRYPRVCYVHGPGFSLDVFAGPASHTLCSIPRFPSSLLPESPILVYYHISSLVIPPLQVAQRNL